MDTFLLTWNKDKSRWDSFDADCALAKQQGYLKVERSCGNSGLLLKGSRVFLVKQGKEPTGIVGSGVVISERPVPKESWDDASKTANYVQVRLDTLLHPDRELILNRKDLSSESLIKATNTPKSGPRLKPADAALLESLWAPFVWTTERAPERIAEEVHPADQFWEGALRSITINAYERDAKARQSCIAHFGSACRVCGLDFGRVYGELGRGYIHVHHIRPLSEIGEGYAVDPQKDLIPVCPNCHAMMHQRIPPLTEQELKQIIEAQ